MTGTVLPFPNRRTAGQTPGQARSALDAAFRDAARLEAEFLQAVVAAQGCTSDSAQANTAMQLMMAAGLAAQRVLICTMTLALTGGDVLTAWQELDGIGTADPPGVPA